MSRQYNRDRQIGNPHAEALGNSAYHFGLAENHRCGNMFFEMARQPILRECAPSFCLRTVNASMMVVAFIVLISGASPITSTATTPAEVLAGLRHFYAKTSKPDGSFSPGIDPEYRGMSDSAYSDLAAVTYAVTIHKTFGWKLVREKQTIEFLLTRQRTSGNFYNVGGTVDPQSAEGRVYNTTQGIVALRALGLKPRFDPLPVFEEILKQDYKTLPPYSTSFFPLAYLAYGCPIPPEADRRIRATMIQAPDGYLNDHIAATFHAVHYYRLIGESTPLATPMVERALRDQKPDGSWLLNPPARDRHATFDAVFALWQLGPPGIAGLPSRRQRLR